MSLRNLTKQERQVVYQCLACVAEGKVIQHDWEFPIVFGLQVDEFLAIFRAWPQIDDSTESVKLAINNALNNLLGYPHAYHERWSEVIGVSKQEVTRVFAKWRGESNANTVAIEELLAEHTLGVRELVEALRQVVRTTAPAATEKANRGWHSISYHDRRGGYFCGIFPQAESVKLVFEFGVLLPDPAGILQNGGKQVRFVLLQPGDELPVAPIQQLIRAALDLPADRATKLALMRG